MSVGEQERFTREQIFGILRRIKYPLANPDVLPEPTLETLRELQCHCIASIPFETLSLRMTKSREVDISLQGIYDRIVNKHRGGWCFSLNRLAFELLRGLGYTVQFTLARVCKPQKYGDPISFSALTHRVSLVRFAEGPKYLFDIGFGNTSFYPLPLEEGAEVDFLGHKRRMAKTVHNLAQPELLGNPPEQLWCSEEYMGEDKWVPCYAFTEQQFYEVDCEVGNFYTCFSPQSHFFDQFWCFQGTLDGHYNMIIGNEFKIRSATGTVKKIVFEKEQERLDVLEKYFGIVLTEDELKYHDQRIE
ncbi:N-terminal acetyltransferase [Mortierella polycephala]|uniref:N-terminal acetyltransferase n=1 Tax=Mortierella polycephala TaxID=41804 RepID=A0A9P6PQV2_9FUNG|nr:N-terminal acetyltransferase [Mortierella polycephala]